MAGETIVIPASLGADQPLGVPTAFPSIGEQLDANGKQTAELNGVRYRVRPATAEEAFYAQMGLDSLRQTVPYLNDVLQRLVTLTTVVIGAALLVAREGVMTRGWLAAAVVAQMLALGLAFAGLFPRGGHLAVSDPDAVKAFEVAACQRKRFFLAVAFAFFLAGLGIALAGVLAAPA